ncbi:hypothetical protein ABT329_40310, partial [Streptomyces minutiscleroticus]
RDTSYHRNTPTTKITITLIRTAQKRYTLATPRERALLGAVQARSLAADGQKRAAIAAFLRAEDDLAAADAGDEEPSRVWFFQRASLAHETARTLWTLGDLDGALREFNNSQELHPSASAIPPAGSLGQADDRARRVFLSQQQRHRAELRRQAPGSMHPLHHAHRLHLVTNRAASRGAEGGHP